MNLFLNSVFTNTSKRKKVLKTLFADKTLVHLKTIQTPTVSLLDGSAEMELRVYESMFIPWALAERDAGCPSGRLRLQTEIENLWYRGLVDLL